MKKILSIFGCNKGRIREVSTRPSIKRDKEQPNIEENKQTENSNKPTETNLQNVTEKNEIVININDSQNNEHENKNEQKEEENTNQTKENNKDKEKNTKGLNMNKEISDTDALIDENSSLICSYEKGIIKYTKKDLVAFFNQLENLDGFKEYYNRKNLKIEIRTAGSPINSEFYLIKALYVQKKSELGKNANYEGIIRIMYDIDERLKWDKAVKKLEKFEGNDSVFVVRTWAHSVLIISEREGIEKRMIFKYNNAQYVLSSSVPDDVSLLIINCYL